jgi:glycosyltransferase involved in cell wall biosynthesis
MQILFLSPWHPYPPDNGARLRIFNILSGLAAHHDISLLTLSSRERMAELGELEQICKKVRVLQKKDYDPGSRKAIFGFFSQKPRVLVDRFLPEMHHLIQNELSSGDYDLVIASEIYMADYLLDSLNIPSIFEDLEIGVFTDAVNNMRNPIKKIRNRFTLSKMINYYHLLLEKFSYITVVSETEKQLLLDFFPGNESISVIPNGVNLNDYREVNEHPQPNTLIFSGALSFDPNYHAMEWFSSQVLPLIKMTHPDVQLVITGKHGGRKLTDDGNINFVGYVDDIRPLISSAWISVAPIFTGGGTRLKILEAFGLRTPVISTSKGAEGLDVFHDKHLLIADSAESFAEETVRLLNDNELRKELTSNAYQLVQEKYDWPVIIPKFLSLIERVV